MTHDQLQDDEIVLRHIPGGTTWQAPGPRVTSKNFELRPGEAGISVSRAAITAPDQFMALRGNPATGSRIASAPVAGIRGLGLEVIPDPIPDDPGHALIVSATSILGENDHPLRKRLAVLFKFAA